MTGVATIVKCQLPKLDVAGFHSECAASRNAICRRLHPAGYKEDCHRFRYTKYYFIAQGKMDDKWTE